jgi:hypothetical protein
VQNPLLLTATISLLILATLTLLALLYHEARSLYRAFSGDDP